MFERFTDRARKVMALANQMAQRYRHECIDTEHILLGLVKEGGGVGANVLRNLDVDYQVVKRAVERQLGPGPDLVTMSKLSLSPNAKKTIEYAIEEGRNLNHNYVGTEHLLLGLTRDREFGSAQILTDFGLRLEELREEVLNLLGADIEVSNNPVKHLAADHPLVELATFYEQLVEFGDTTYKRLRELGKEKDQAVIRADYETAAEFRAKVERIRKIRDQVNLDLKKYKEYLKSALDEIGSI